jgi:hypothetical protein
MSISVRPDPDHPLGGYALLEIDESLPQGPVSVSILDLAEDRYLGPKGWQQAPVALGPFEARDEGGKVVVPVGPGIVDNIDEYATLKLTVGGVSGQLSWPDTIRTSPDRVGLGGLGMLAGSAPAKAAPPPPPPPEPPVTPDPPPEKPVDTGPETIDPVPEQPKSLLVPILLGLVLLAAIAGGAWYYLTQMQEEPPVEIVEEPEPEPEPSVEEPEPAPPVQQAGCDAEGLAAAAALEPGPAFEAIAGCGADSDADRRLAIIERAAEAGVPAAIAMIGRWYDPAQADEVGSGFATRDAGQAARYYSEALEAGYEAAQPLLDAACAALDPSANPLHEIAQEDYCN